MFMTQRANNYAAALYELTDDKAAVDVLRTLFEETPLLGDVLADPMSSLDKKHQIINDIADQAELPVNIKNFLKYLCDHTDSDLILEIIGEYDILWEDKHNIIRAELYFAETPDEEEMTKTMDFLRKEYPGRDIQTKLFIRDDLLGGLLIRVGHMEYDWSYEGRLRQLERKLTVR